jgi:hypothetical protein
LMGSMSYEFVTQPSSTTKAKSAEKNTGTVSGNAPGTTMRWSLSRVQERSSSVKLNFRLSAVWHSRPSHLLRFSF